MAFSRVMPVVRDVAAIRPTRVEIDLAAVCANAAQVRGIAGPVFAVVKADAYGHGAVPVARALAAARARAGAGAGAVDGLAVSLVEEGAALRDAGVTLPILVMGPALDGGHEEIVARGMIPFVSDRGDLVRFADIGRSRGTTVPVHLKVDTGMTRLGLTPAAAREAIAWAEPDTGVEVAGVATHLACADIDAPDDPDSMTRNQLARLDELVAGMRTAVGGARRVVHAANSSAALRFPGSRYDLVRPGIALYGNGPAAAEKRLQQAMRLCTRIVQLRTAGAGSAVSYNALWRAQRPSRLAVLPVGYADGYPRSVTGSAEVLIRGRRCPVAGAVSMDITIADVTDLGDAVAVGDEVVLLGAQGDERISAAEFAAHAGLIEYEVTCGISKRVPRVYG